MNSELVELMIRSCLERIIDDLKNGKYTTYFVMKETGVTNTTLNKLKKGTTSIDKLSTESLFALLTFYEERYGVPRVPDHEDDDKLIID